MPDSKLTSLTENTIPVSTDLLYLVDDPAGTALSQKITVQSLLDVGVGLLTKPIVLTQGTITADTPQIDGTVTWNNAGILGPAWKLNVTATSANAAALLADLQVGAVSKWKVNRTGLTTQTGPGLFPDGTTSNVALGFASSVNTGFRHATGIIRGVSGGSDIITWSSGGFGVNHSGLSFFDAAFSTLSVSLYSESLGYLALRNAAVAQAFRVYRTFTDASNYERAVLQSGSGYFELAAETVGTGTDNIDLRLTPAGTGVVRFGSHSAVAAETVTGYITIKDSGGTSRKIAVIS